MATIKPFRALRPDGDRAKQVSCVPYDVVYESEVRAYLAQNPLSFLRVTRAEGEFPEGSAPPAAEVFARARQNLERFISDNIYALDESRAYYVYRLGTSEHEQTGIVGVCSIDEYEQGLIKKHENVRPDKVEDRTGHLLGVEAQTGLIFLAFRSTDEIDNLFTKAVRSAPIFDFRCADGIRQRVWRIGETATWTEAFRGVPSLYIADGHHRAESALLARNTRRDANPEHNGNENYNFVLAGMFPASELAILPYNRVVKDLNGMGRDDFFERIRENFILADDSTEKVPGRRGEFAMYIAGQWHKLRFNPQDKRRLNAIENLDVSILQDNILGPVLGIDDPRTNERIGFVGGARGTDELERLVNEGNAKVAFSLYPTTMGDLLAVSDMGETMPPKSTWFEPKLRDGLLVFQI